MFKYLYINKNELLECIVVILMNNNNNPTRGMMLQKWWLTNSNLFHSIHKNIAKKMPICFCFLILCQSEYYIASLATC